jgi:hypothetical protein
LDLWLVDLLSPVVMSVVQAFSSYMMLSLACVFVRVFGLQSLVMWDGHGEDRWCDLSKVGMVETVGFHQKMWLVMLESAKDQILGVDTAGQHMPSRVRYGMACWVIRKALVSMSCRKRGTAMAIPTRPQGVSGAMRVFCCTQEEEILAITKGAWGYSVVPNKGKPMAKQDIRAGVNLYKGR